MIVKREELQSRLKEDSKLAWEYIKESMEDACLDDYFSKKNIERRIKRIKKRVRQEYRNIPATYVSAKKFFPRFMKKGKKQFYEYIRKISKNIPKILPKISKPHINQTVKDVALCAGSYVLFSMIIPNDNVSDKLKPASDAYKKYAEIKIDVDELIDKKLRERKLKEIEKNKKLYQKQQKDSVNAIISQFPREDDILTDDKLRGAFFPEPNELEETVKKRYQYAQGARMGDNISLTDLLEKASVEVNELQSAITKNPDILTKLTPGRTNIKLAKAADTRQGVLRRRCLEGVQKIFDKAGLPNIISGGAPNWPPKFKGCSNNSAYNAYIPLEKNGDFVIISLENKAYGKHPSSKENKYMKNFCLSLIPGQIIITDNVVPDEKEYRSYRKLQLEYGVGGKVHGHIAVKDNKGYYKSDGTEPTGPNFSRYGDNVKFPLPRDINIPREIALEIIRESEMMKRQEHTQKSQSAQQQYIPFNWYEKDRV